MAYQDSFARRSSLLSRRRFIPHPEREFRQTCRDDSRKTQNLTSTIRTVKREIRVLGIDACRERQVFGAVVRGGLYLDGIICHELEAQAEKGLANAILKSKYFPELRMIMLHDPKARVDSDNLGAKSKLPTMV